MVKEKSAVTHPLLVKEYVMRLTVQDMWYNSQAVCEPIRCHRLCWQKIMQFLTLLIICKWNGVENGSQCYLLPVGHHVIHCDETTMVHYHSLSIGNVWYMRHAIRKLDSHSGVHGGRCVETKQIQHYLLPIGQCKWDVTKIHYHSQTTFPWLSVKDGSTISHTSCQPCQWDSDGATCTEVSSITHILWMHETTWHVIS